MYNSLITAGMYRPWNAHKWVVNKHKGSNFDMKKKPTRLVT